MQSYEQAAAFCATLGIDPVFDWRCIHDTNRGVPAIPLRGTLEECWPTLIYYNNLGYGVFTVISILDGTGRKMENVTAVRAHFVDLDNLSSDQNYARASAANPAPAFGVNTSIVYNDDGSIRHSKWHTYWPVQPYVDNVRFETVQRKLRQTFDSDKGVIDPTRVMRVPGTLNLKRPEQPHLVQCFALSGYGQRTTIEHLEAALSSVNVIDGGIGERHELGDPDLAAPSLDWLQRAMDLTDPNTLNRLEWISFTAAVKQAGWSLTDQGTLYNMWSNWCERYEHNDLAENLKQYQSIRNSEVGWPSLQRRVPQMLVERHVTAPVMPPQQPGTTAPAPLDPGANIQPPPMDCSGEYLNYIEQEMWFKGCYYVDELAKIMTDDCRFLSSTQFNVRFGGKLFMWNSEGKITDEAWKAATRGTQYKVPMVDHTRFLPDRPFQAIIEDDLGRKGINSFKPPIIRRVQGDPSPFLRHIGFMLPDPGDQRILLDYLAHNIKYPGHKIPWAPVIQSVEGVGKGIIKRLMRHCIGNIYMHAPNAKELADSGAKFNAWMKNKLFILADEIKVDDRRDMIEVLKPMVSEEEIEVQSKGVDQKIEDNYSNWLFFTNYKDAVPINKNSRRFAIFYSAFQSKEQLQLWQMGKAYFDALYAWMKADGAAIMYGYFMNYDIERGAVPMNAPNTSSHAEVIRCSMGAVERMIHEAVEDHVPGFRGGWVSSVAVRKRMQELGLRSMQQATVEKIITEMGYQMIGRSVKTYAEEDIKTRSTLFNLSGIADVNMFGPLQGYH